MIGSGKSTAADYFKSFGFEIIDADLIGKQVVENNQTVLKRLANIFGSDILTPSGRLRRKVLGGKAFANEKSRLQLNQIVHPYLLKELYRQLKEHQKNQKNIVIDAALLLEWNLEKEMDLTLLIHASKEIRVKRALKRGFKIEDIQKIQMRQMTYTHYRKRVDKVILNNSTPKRLYQKLESIIKKLPLV